MPFGQEGNGGGAFVHTPKAIMPFGQEAAAFVPAGRRKAPAAVRNAKVFDMICLKEGLDNKKK